MPGLEVSAGGLTFDAVETGPHDGRPVLFLHGFPQTSLSWRHQLEALGEAGYRALAFDQRGYSPEARPPSVEDYQIGELVDDVLGVADQWGLDRFDIVGHDWGAMVAWVVAARHPERVRTLTAVSVPHPRAFAAAFGTGGDGDGDSTSASAGDEDQRQRSSYIEVFRAEGGVAERALLGKDGSGSGLRAMFDASGLSSDSDEVRAFVATMLEPGAMTAALELVPSHRAEFTQRCGSDHGPHPLCVVGQRHRPRTQRGGSDGAMGVRPVPFRGPRGCQPLDPRDRTRRAEPPAARAPGGASLTPGARRSAGCRARDARLGAWTRPPPTRSPTRTSSSVARSARCARSASPPTPPRSTGTPPSRGTASRRRWRWSCPPSAFPSPTGGPAPTT